jgi:O-antigen/teichoic acid export membrane protein
MSEEIERSGLQRLEFIEASMSPFRKFIKQFSHFFAGMMMTQVFAFVTFPILTRVLTKEQYGILGLVTTTMLFSVAIAKAGMSDGVIRFYKEYSVDREKLETFSSTILARGVMFSAVGSVFYFIFLLLIRNYLRVNEGYIICFLIMTFSLFLGPLDLIVISFLRVNDKTIFMNVLGVVERICSISLSLFLLLYVFKAFYGYFVGLVIAEAVVSAVLFYWFFRHFSVNRSKVSNELNLKLIKFGAPLLLAELSFLLMSYADRYLVVAFLGEEALGLYSVGYNLAMYIGNIMMFSISYAIVPIYVETYGAEGREKTEAFLGKSLKYLLAAIFPMWFGYLGISKELFIVLASEKYAMAAKFSPIILLGYFCLVLNTIFNAGLYLRKKTMITCAIMLSAVIFNIALNLLLLRRFGITAAAVIAAGSCMLSLILTIWISNKFVTVRVELKSLVYYLSVSVLMYLVMSEIGTPMAWLNLVLKLIVGACIVILAVICKEYENLKGIVHGYKLRAG